MEKKNNGLVIVLILIILCLGGFILYDKNVFGLKGNNKESNVETNNNSTNTKDENIKIGSIGNKETKIILDITDGNDYYFTIKEGKVVYHKQDGTEVIDSTIPDKVVQIAKGFSCNGGDSRIAALTEKGEVYYNKNESLNSISKDNHDCKFDFIKVIAEEKIYGIDSVAPKGFNSCGYTDLYAYVNKEDMKKINVERDTKDLLTGERTSIVVSASLGRTYYELYPYVKDYIIFDLDGPILLQDKDGKLYYYEHSSITNANMFLTIDNKYIYADKVYYKAHDDNKNEMVIVDKDKNVYLLTTSKTNKNYYKYTYTLENTGKAVKNLKEEKIDDYSSNYTLEYTDGTSEVVH